MTLLELLKLLRLHVKRIVIAAISCALIAGGAVAALGFVSPKYSASSSLVISQGTVASVGGIASSKATEVSGDGVAVSAKTTTTSNTVSFTATGSSPDSCISAANDALANTQSEADKLGALVAGTASKATSAVSQNKNPLLYAAVGAMAGLFVMVAWYVMKDTMHPRVWDWHSVEQGADLTFLGEVTNDRPQLSLICANLGLASTKGRHSETKRVYFIPAGDDVNGDEVFALLGSIRYSACTMALGAPLSQTPNTLFAAREADSVVVIVEEGCSALADIELIIRELKIAGVEPAGFIYLPTSKRSSR